MLPNKLLIDDAIKNDLTEKGLQIQYADSSVVSLVMINRSAFSDIDIKLASEILGGFLIGLSDMCRKADFSIVEVK